MVAPTKRRLLKIVLLVLVVFSAAYGVLFSLRFALGTEYPVVVVNGISMIPTFYEGDLLVVQGVPDKSLIAVSDIIVFHDPYDWDTLIVHRVVEIRPFDDQLTFRTKGDNNIQADFWQVREEHIIGRVLQKIPYVGGMVTAIQSPYGIGILYSLIVILIILEVFSSGDSKDDRGLASTELAVLKVLGRQPLRLLGVIDAILAWIVIYLAVQRNPWFIVTEHAFSDLGGPLANDPTFFNTGLIGLGVLFSLYALTLIQDATNKVETMGSAFAWIAGVFLTLIGVYPSGTAPHAVVSLWFFAQTDLAITAWGIGILLSGWDRVGAVVTGIGVVGPLIAIAEPWPSLAVAEAFGIALIDVWIALMLRVHYVRLRRPPATYVHLTPQ